MVQKLPGLGYMYAFVITCHLTDQQNPTNLIILLWACPDGIEIWLMGEIPREHEKFGKNSLRNSMISRYF
jgi:hypothetical protein